MPVTQADLDEAAASIRAGQQAVGGAPQPIPIAAPTDPILDHAENTLTKIANVQNLWDNSTVLPPQMDGSQRPTSGNDSPMLQWTGPDDRTLLQKYVLGTVRQVAASALDMTVGLAGVGAEWVSAGLAGSAKLLSPDNPDGVLKAAKQINTVAGSLFRVIDEVAGRPVITVPDWVPFLGGQDAIRIGAGFASMAFLGGTSAARVAESLPIKALEALGVDTSTQAGRIVAHLGTAVGFNLATGEARPAYELATAKDNEETIAALKGAGTVALASGAMGAAFFGLGFGFEKFKGKLEEARIDTRREVAEVNAAVADQARKNLKGGGEAPASMEPLSAPSEPNSAQKAYAYALAHDAINAGSPIGDAALRVDQLLKQGVTGMPGPKIIENKMVDQVGIGGMDVFRDMKSGQNFQFIGWDDQSKGRMVTRRILKDGSWGDGEIRKNLKDVQWVRPTLDPSVQLPAVQHEGTIYIGEGLTHSQAFDELERARPDIDFTKDENANKVEGGWIWGQEKRFYDHEQLVEAQSAMAERQKLLVQVEDAKRLADSAADAARAEPDMRTGAPPGEDPKITAEQRRIAMDVIGKLKEGDTFHNPEIVAQLGHGARESKFWGPLANILDSFKPKIFMNPEERADLFAMKGEANGVIQRYNQEAQGIGDNFRELFKSAPEGGANVGALAHTAAAASDPLVKAAAMEGFNQDQVNALQATTKTIFDRMWEEREKAGVVNPKEQLKDFFTRIWKGPVNVVEKEFQRAWNKLEIGPVRDMHTYHRLFATWESAIEAGLKPRFDHIGDVMQAYISSTGETIAKTMLRQKMMEFGKSHDLMSVRNPGNWKIIGDGKDAYFGGHFLAPDFRATIKPLFERPLDLPFLKTVDQLTQLSKKWSLGLNFFHMFQSVRSMAGTTLNPVNAIRLFRLAGETIAKDPEFMQLMGDSNLKINMPSNLWKDRAEWRGKMEFNRRAGVAQSLIHNPLDEVRNLFDHISDLSIQQMYLKGKTMAALYEDNHFQAKYLKENGEIPTYDQRVKNMQSAAPKIDNLYGDLNYAGLGRSQNLRALSRLAFLAPDWLESRLRMFAGATSEGANVVLSPIKEMFGDKGAMARAVGFENTRSLRPMITMAATMGLGTELLNMAFNGGKTTASNEKQNKWYVQLPWETKYGTHIGVNLWGYADMPFRIMDHFLHAEPQKAFLEHGSPPVRLALNVLANLDNFGEPLKGDIAIPGTQFALPPTSERDKNARILIQKAMSAAGLFIPIPVVDSLVAMDRSVHDSAFDAVRWLRSAGSFVSVKVSSGYPQELRQDIQFFEDNEAWTKSEYNRLRAQGRVGDAMQLRQDWNSGIVEAHRKIAMDPVTAMVFQKRRTVLDRMRIR